jgi:hypothetical protein
VGATPVDEDLSRPASGDQYGVEFISPKLPGRNAYQEVEHQMLDDPLYEILQSIYFIETKSWRHLLTSLVGSRESNSQVA